LGIGTLKRKVSKVFFNALFVQIHNSGAHSIEMFIYASWNNSINCGLDKLKNPFSAGRHSNFLAG
jgi:hypothetical protein